MKQSTTYLAFFLASIISGCSSDHAARHQDHLLQATTWYQHAAEMRALYYQSFNWAGRELDERISEGSVKPLAVVLDIDETVLDNSPQTAQQIVENEPFNNEMWDEWCSMAKARPLPGALDFTKRAAAQGVEVFYISNRGIHLLDATINNLRTAGYPFSDSSHVLLKTSTSIKDSRREKVKETHEIVLLIGDNLGDFSGIFENRLEGMALERVNENRELFGTTYIILPNPMYGSWEKPFRGESPPETVAIKKEKLKPYKH